MVSLLQKRVVHRSSVVYSRAALVKNGTNLLSLKLHTRLPRVGYQKVSHTPHSPGEFSVSTQRTIVYLREFSRPDGTIQQPSLVEFQLSDRGIVQAIVDKKFNRVLEDVYLEPEVLSLLGNTSTRAVLPKRIEDFPPPLVNAILSIEDERFYTHFGIDPFAIIRAATANFKTGKIVQGGSTITQQLAKNLFLTRDRSYVRKLMEALYAVFIETAFDKEQILELYMNEIFLGQEGNTAIHGFGEASLSFFGKNVEDISVAEAATLAAIIKGPSSYSPRRHPRRAEKRRNVVLGKMRTLGMLNTASYQQAISEKLRTIPPQRTKRIAPYFSSHVTQKFDSLTLSTSRTNTPLALHTTLDTEIQQCATHAVSEELERLEMAYPALRKKGERLEAALVALEPKTGEIRAWVGGRNFNTSQFDRVSLAKRQPGSLFKPIAYLSAFDESLNDYRVARTTSLLVDEPIALEVKGTGMWRPQNYDRKFRGDVTVREALYSSLNIPTVNLALKVGVKNIAKTARLLGIKKNLLAVPSLALGAIEATPLEMAQAYQTIANGGVHVPLKLLQTIVDTESEKISYRMPELSRPVVDEAAVYVLTDVMRDVFHKGTARRAERLGFIRDAAGKTGTSNDGKDAWFGGFTPSLLAVIWVGFDDNKKTGLTGSTGALPIWVNFMNCALEHIEEKTFVPPENVVFRQVDLRTGLLLDNWCRNPIPATEVFVKDTEPVTYCRDEYDDRQWDVLSRPSSGRRKRVTGPRSGEFWDSLWGN